MEGKFKSPDKEYTPYPFWFWNDELDEGEIKRQIKEMNDKGVNGFVLHPRIGIPKDIVYLGEKFFHYVKVAVKEAEKLGMRVILYDEGMYPSGSANGQVVEKHPEYASRGIYSIKAEEFKQDNEGFQEIIFKYLIKDGKIIEEYQGHSGNNLYYLVHEDSKGTIRGIHYGEDDGEENAPASVDLLNKKAIKYFMLLTHESYYENLKEFFGSTIVGFFTDEPDILGRNAQKNMLPFNDELYKKLSEEGFDLKDIALATLEEKDSLLNQKYAKCVTDLLSENYYQPISNWCKEHNIFLTGHPHGSDDLGLQEHFQIPGQDTVWRWVAPENKLNVTGTHSTLAKCSSDAARHKGIGRNSNEVFGCCGKDGIQWSLSPTDMKWYLNWLFIRGVNMIIPHAFFYSIRGERKHERAPDVGLNNLWWDKYHYFSQFIKRCSYMFSDVVNQTNICIIAQADFMPHQGLDTLYENQIEFNYLLDDYVFDNKVTIHSSFIEINKQAYDTVLIPETYLKIDLIKDKLKEFEAAGGQLIIYNNEISDSLLEKLKDRYTADIQFKGENLSNIRLSHFKKEGTEFYALSNEGFSSENLEVTFNSNINSFEIWDPWEGTINHYKLVGSQSEFTIQANQLVFIKPSVEESEEVYESNRTEETSVDVSIKHTDQPLSDFGSWTETEELAFYSGSIQYTLAFHNTDDLSDNHYLLDLGRVKEFVTLIIDGKESDTKFWAPYCFTLTKEDMLNSEIQLEVTNTLANKYDRIKLESGLIDKIKVLKVIS
ncbi:hypothetical protein GCM10008932_01210 [Alkalibacterium iburiense]|uniref:Uncharacterized protein n=1 Tax=Alkalibacterium iburiense TaxID=290589 RepID=A0ABP3GPX5_9LACT